MSRARFLMSKLHKQDGKCTGIYAQPDPPLPPHPSTLVSFTKLELAANNGRFYGLRFCLRWLYQHTTLLSWHLDSPPHPEQKFRQAELFVFLMIPSPRRAYFMETVRTHSRKRHPLEAAKECNQNTSKRSLLRPDIWPAYVTLLWIILTKFWWECRAILKPVHPRVNAIWSSLFLQLLHL